MRTSRGISLVELNRREGGNAGDFTPGSCALGRSGRGASSFDVEATAGMGQRGRMLRAVCYMHPATVGKADGRGQSDMKLCACRDCCGESGWRLCLSDLQCLWSPP